jgi:hypothetical protein
MGRGLCAVLLCAAATLPAQSRRAEPSPADAAIAAGRLDAAEEALYAAVRRSPREPSARGALGDYLAARGRIRAGSVLLEEARQFGGDPRRIEPRLTPLYARLGEWRMLDGLTFGGLDEPSRDRVRWLIKNPPGTRGADSTTLTLEPNDASGLGRVQLRIGGVELAADIDPTSDDVIVPRRALPGEAVQLFGSTPAGASAVALELRLGSLVLTNVPIRIEGDAAAVRLGLGWLAQLMPTVDPIARTLRLRAPPERSTPQAPRLVPPEPAGEALPLLFGFPGVRIVARVGSAPIALESAAGRAALRGARWTLDPVRGAIYRESPR